jgi:hypothetical protein
LNDFLLLLEKIQPHLLHAFCTFYANSAMYQPAAVAPCKTDSCLIPMTPTPDKILAFLLHLIVLY